MASMTEEEMLAWALKQSADQSTDEIDVGNPGDKKADGQNDRALTKKGAQYQLQSIVAHSGDTPHCGHYVTWCRRWETSTWICYNDSTASEHDNLPLSVKTQAYILLYQKKDMKE
ncbi:unnamed protein product [Amoebophrya sp. A25]|nr:unnamed protein product [Amoebophrya sp. A25]|eukprot:GSA25T00008489001.1